MAEQTDLLERIIRAVYEADRAWLNAGGVDGVPPFGSAETVLADAVRHMVQAVLDGDATSAEGAHAAWLGFLVGWTAPEFGGEVSLGRKLHPDARPWAELSNDQRLRRQAQFSLAGALGSVEGEG